MKRRFQNSRKILIRRLPELGILLMLAVAGAMESSAQMRGNSEVYPHTWDQDPTQQSYPGDPAAQAAMEKRIKAMNAERQKQVVADAAKLVKLTAELNAEINNAHQSELTPEQLHKVAEIEKLAHNIREKMSMSLQGIPPPSMEPGTVIHPGEE